MLSSDTHTHKINNADRNREKERTLKLLSNNFAIKMRTKFCANEHDWRHERCICKLPNVCVYFEINVCAVGGFLRSFALT